MSDAHREREFVRSLKASPRKGAAIAITLLILIFGAMVLLPLAHDSSVPKQPSVVNTGAKAPQEQVEETFSPPPDPVIGLSLITSGDIPDGIAIIGMQTVVVRAISSKSNDAMFGTGFIAKDGIVVTAAHLLWHFNVSDKVTVEVYCDGQRLPAKVLMHNDSRDVAVLSAPACTGTELSIGAYKPKRGHEDVLYATGYTFDEALRSAERFAQKTHPLDDKGSCAEIDVGLRRLGTLSANNRSALPYGVFTGALIQGNSGSPVVDEQGRVIGMFVIFNSTKDFSCYVPGEEIAKLLETIP